MHRAAGTRAPPTGFGRVREGRTFTDHRYRSSVSVIGIGHRGGPRDGAGLLGNPFLIQRLREWSLVRAVTLEQPWQTDELLESSNWLQLKMSEESNGTALEILADGGRTKRIRHQARTRLRQRSRS